MTVSDLITQAYEKISINPTSAEITSGLAKLNILINSLSVHNDFQFVGTERNFTLTSGKSDYTIGESGADVSVIRPILITSAHLRDTGGNKYPIKVVGAVKYDNWDIPVSGQPTELHYRPTYPNGTIKLDYLSSNSTDSLYIVTSDPFAEFALVGDTFNFPPEYQLAFIYALATELAVDEHTDMVAYLEGRKRSELEKISNIYFDEVNEIQYDEMLRVMKYEDHLY